MQGETFLRARRSRREDVGKGQYAVIGVPHELTKISRPGTSEGPRAVREATLGSDFFARSYAGGELVDLQSGEGFVYRPEVVVDTGDVLLATSVEENVTRISDATAAVSKRGGIPVTLGGDHFVTYPALKGVASTGSGPLAYIHVDMHADLIDTVPGFGKLSCGSPLRRLLEDGVLEAERTLIFGLDPLVSREEAQYIQEAGVEIVTNQTIIERGATKVLAPALQRVLDGAKALYVSFDIDVLARHFAPGTGNTEGVAGLRPEDVMEVARAVRSEPLVGFDLVEVSPQWDPSGRTAAIGAGILVEVMRPTLFEITQG